MKIKILVLALLSNVLLVEIVAQSINGKKSYPLYKQGAKYVSDYDKSGYEIVRIEYDLVFTKKESFRNLYPKWEYLIYAFADKGVKDLNLKLFEYDDLIDKWTLIDEDITNKSYASLKIKPNQKTLYKVEIIVKEFYEGYKAARYGLMYIHD